MNAQRSTPNAQRPSQFQFGVRRSAFNLQRFCPTPNASFQTPPCRAGFTLFELLAVITIIGIVLAVTLGSFTGWGDAHAVRGSAEVVEAALVHAHDYAVAHRIPVSFEYQTDISETGGVKRVARFQLLREVSTDAATNLTALTSGSSLPENLGTIQRLPGSVWLIRQIPVSDPVNDATDRIVFLPNGRASNPTPLRETRLYVVSRKMRNNQKPNMIYQIDVNTADSTVAVTKLNPEDLAP